MLGLTTSEYLYRRHPDEHEGQLTKTKSLLVSKAILSRRALRMGLGRFVLMSHSEVESGGRQRLSILADAFESVLGAIYLDQGFEAARAAGASRSRILFRLIPREALGPLLLGYTFVVVALVDMTAMAGAIGAGGTAGAARRIRIGFFRHDRGRSILQSAPAQKPPGNFFHGFNPVPRTPPFTAAVRNAKRRFTCCAECHVQSAPCWRRCSPQHWPSPAA